MRKRNALARRLLRRQVDYLRCTRYRRVPADSKGSARGLRTVVSRCMVTSQQEQFRAVRSYLSTAAQHGNHHFDVLSLAR